VIELLARAAAQLVNLFDPTSGRRARDPTHSLPRARKAVAQLLQVALEHVIRIVHGRHWHITKKRNISVAADKVDRGSSDDVGRIPFDPGCVAPVRPPVDVVVEVAQPREVVDGAAVETLPLVKSIGVGARTPAGAPITLEPVIAGVGRIPVWNGLSISILREIRVAVVPLAKCTGCVAGGSEIASDVRHFQGQGAARLRAAPDTRGMSTGQQAGTGRRASAIAQELLEDDPLICQPIQMRCVSKQA
jgi:hypothetical protein